MKDAFSLALASLKERPSNWVLSAASVACGTALLCMLVLLFSAVEEGLSRNAKNIDVVVGAKGSGLQLVLSSVYQADIPNGNIPMGEWKKISAMKQVKKAVPVAMGDSYKGFRVMGTTADYLRLYDASIAQGKIFSANFEVVAGARTGLEIGDIFSASHGFADGGDVHKDHVYTVAGILDVTGTIADKLLITTYQSVQESHTHHDHEHEEAHEHHDDDDHHQAEIAAILIQVRGTADRINLPRQINRSENVLAASPSYEMTRLSQNLGVGRDFILAVSLGAIALSTILLFSALASGMAARQYDLAVLRVLGASPGLLFCSVLFEGVAIGLAGAAMGVMVGHVAAFVAASSLSSLKGMVVAQHLLFPAGTDFLLLALGVLAGTMAAMLPARRASRADIATLLSRSAA